MTYEQSKAIEGRLSGLIADFFVENEDDWFNAEGLAERLIDKGIIVCPTNVTYDLYCELQEYVYNRCVEEL